MTVTLGKSSMDEAQQEAILQAAATALETAEMSPMIGGEYSSVAPEEARDVYLGNTALEQLVSSEATLGGVTMALLPSIEASGDIRFGGGVPVGGWTTLAMYPNGSWVFSGHLRDSGAPSYNGAVTWMVTTRDGNPAFSFSATGRMHGTFEPGSRNWDWTKTGRSSALAAAWPELSTGYRWRWQANVNINLGFQIDAIKQALGIVGAVIALA